MASLAPLSHHCITLASNPVGVRPVNKRVNVPYLIDRQWIRHMEGTVTLGGFYRCRYSFRCIPRSLHRRAPEPTKSYHPRLTPRIRAIFRATSTVPSHGALSIPLHAPTTQHTAEHKVFQGERKKKNVANTGRGEASVGLGWSGLRLFSPKKMYRTAVG